MRPLVPSRLQFYWPIALYLTLAVLALAGFDLWLMWQPPSAARLARWHAYKDILLVVSATLTVLAWAHHQRQQMRHWQSVQRERDRRLAIIADAASDWIWETDANFRFRYISTRFYELTGISAEEIIGQRRWDLSNTEDDPQMWQEHQLRLQQHLPFRNFVYSLQRPSIGGKNARIIRISGNPVFDRLGRFQGYLGVGTDITAQRASEQALEESRRLLATVLSNLPGMVYRCEPGLERRLQYVSQGCVRLIGKSPQLLLDSSGFGSFIHPGDRARVYETLQTALERRLHYSLTYRLKEENGREHWAWEQGNGVFDEDGELLFLEGLITDISEQKAAEDEARRIRIYLKSVIDSMPSILIGVNEHGLLLDWNRHAAKMSGLSWNQAVGRDFAEVFPQISNYRKQVLAAIHEQRTFRPQRLRAEHAGKTQHLEVMVYPLLASQELGAVIRVDDVSARVKIEEMMVQAEKMLSVGGLAAGMAHEINNPLGIILQATQNIQRRLDPRLAKNQRTAQQLNLDLQAVEHYFERREIARFLDSIRDAGSRAARIVADMLAFSRRTELSFSPANVHELLETSLRLAANDYQLSQHYDFRRIQVVRDFDRELTTVPCDRTEIEQVLLNLIKNAAQAMLACDMPSPKLTLRTRRELGYACIEVIDNGPGMEDSISRRVFEPFFTTKEVGLGTGLGLSVSYFIVTEQHRGSLTVSSKPGQGARFTLLLPLDEEE